MKISLLGNMNNNNFSLMRYFRDLGADAHLFLWKNDGNGSLSHFTPENDTWDISKWKKFIHQTTLTNAFVSVIGDPRSLRLPVSSKKIKQEFQGYDCYIGSGIAPALLAKARINLDIFYPYSTGVEFVGLAPNGKSIESETMFRRLALFYLRTKQIKGILNARYCLNAEMGPTQETLKRIGKSSIPLAIPMVYNRESYSRNLLSKKILEVKNKLDNYDLKIFSHSRQLWNKTSEYTDKVWQGMNKNNDWLIHGYYELLKSGRSINPILVLLEYGPDFEASKKLCHDLGIESNVLWLPVMPRKELMYLLSCSDIGVGEFTVFPGCIWGGTGWEVLASGKALMQTFNFTVAGYTSVYGEDPPPILDVKSQEDVTKHLIDWYENKEEYLKMGKRSKDWFNACNGIGLSKKWLSLLQPS